MLRTGVDELITNLKVMLPPDGKVGVLFSGGLDSSVLLVLVLEAIGTNRCIALHASTTLLEGWETNEAAAFCNKTGVDIVQAELNPLFSPDVYENTSNRCYYCKRMILDALSEKAKGQGVALIVDGSTLDDDPADRPGCRALSEFGVISPLRLLSLRRTDIRSIANLLGIGKHLVSGSCMATRFKTGVQISLDKVNQLRELESHAKALGCRLARARYDGNSVRLEVDGDSIEALLLHEKTLASYTFELGFAGFSIDSAGYRGEI